MALQYLILVARTTLLDQDMVEDAAARLGMQVQRNGPNVASLTSGGRVPINVDNGHVIIVGDLFDRFGSGPSLDKLETSLGASVLADPMGTLLTRFWGAYLAIWKDGDVITVMRDPSGLLPCCYTVHERYVAFASDPRTLLGLTRARPSIDWGGIPRLLYADDLAQARTGLMDVSDLLAGSVARIDANGCKQAICWSPWQFASREEEATSQTHVDRLGCAVEQCTRGWSSSFSKVLLAASGGLDSSIVASCLDPKIDRECITMATADPRGDETAYARELCTSLSLRLSCYNYHLEDANVLRSAVAHLPRPGARAPMIAYDAAIKRHVEHMGTDLFLTGAGGDNVFYLTHSVRPVVDRFLAEGMSSGLFHTIRDIAKITETGLLEVVAQALRFSRRRGGIYEWRYDGSLLHADCLAEMKRNCPDHPWLAAPNDALPGKAGHIAMITRAQQYLHGYDRRLPFTSVAPLLSQPVVEAALRIPTWIACQGGIDRSAARRAFETRIPANILRRRTKGGPDAFAIQILRSNMELVRDRLLAGRLAGNGIVDVVAVEAALMPERLARDANYVRLLLLLDTEAWIDGWLSADVCAPKRIGVALN
ncbi:asparagine synthase-related protein [Sphingobium sp.]|uniref:asparagine synthase-related protein n=1 Tax=Sphingobium sp. TaxID=1912891 RepID=UPI00257E69B2|nr:asparagine synthase-related protein [Sphingobium sp.]